MRRFTYEWYHNLIELLQKYHYDIVSYHDLHAQKRCVILRHDIDNSISKALQMAKLEQSIGIASTYFVLVSSDFYNIFSKKNTKMLHEIAACGHEIGLHFDEMKYEDLIGNEKKLQMKIQMEAHSLENVVERPVTVMAMHRASTAMLNANLQIPGMINSYRNTFFHDFKYISDSRRHWGASVEQIIEQELYERLHILTHAFWYHEEEKTIHDTVEAFVNSANRERYNTFLSNVREMESIMGREEIR